MFSSDERRANADGLLEKLSRLGNNLHVKDLFSRRMPSGPANALRQKSLDVSHLGVSRTESPGGSGAKILFWAAMGVFVIILMWQIAAGRRAAGAGAGQPAWRLGPWPVDPSQVTTRQDLIRAFEYLALLVLGSPARSWNHLAIARRLSDQPNADPERKHAALHLAALYETARYAPPADPLPDGEMREARRDLCLLAGVACA
jgi:hypothetical protein